MLLRLVLAELRHRPGRALFLLGGYALGVAVMVVLLAVGEAMLSQARDRSLVGGGDVVVVPAGISLEMLKSGGVEALFLGIDNARYFQREILESPRAKREFGVRAASPVMEGRLLELAAKGQTLNVMAAGGIPSRALAAGAPPDLRQGRWSDTEADRRWVAPTEAERLREIDHFHLPRGAVARDSTWAEWHYFNLVLDRERWVYITLLVGGRMDTPGRWGGQVLLTIREPGGRHRSLRRNLPSAAVRLDTTTPDLRLGDATVTLEGARYRVRAAAEGASVDLWVTPAPHRYFPPSDLGGSALVSGYVAPALYATAEGRVCLPRCEAVRGAQAYHDHNWGVWRDVSWEWGSASNQRISLLYGLVRGDSTGPERLFAGLLDQAGARALFRPRPPRVTATRTVQAGGQSLRVPRQMVFEDPAAAIRITVNVEATHLTDLGRPSRRFFVQMRGTAILEQPGAGPEHLSGFFETYLDP